MSIESLRKRVKRAQDVGYINISNIPREQIEQEIRIRELEAQLAEETTTVEDR